MRRPMPLPAVRRRLRCPCASEHSRPFDIANDVIAETQRHVSGDVRLRFDPPGTCTVVGRRSPVALYDHDLATYDASDSFRHGDAEGFVRLWGLGVATWSARQGPGSS